MGLDFEINDYIKSIRGGDPPYKCPKCEKKYKTILGLQYHLNNYDHDNPTPVATPGATPNRGRGRGRWRMQNQPKNNPVVTDSPKEALTFLEAEKAVKYEVDGKSIKLFIDNDLPIISADEYKALLEKPEPEIFSVEPPKEPEVKLPEAVFKIVENYDIPDAPPRPNAYIRFIEKSAEELDGEIEYDVDEEDTAWLDEMNEKRETQNLAPITVDNLELLMDRLEKESFFQAEANGQQGHVVDDDAVCCICMDGECQNTNVILFCDMCNLAVHQDCYGVPYIPEGQWLCRRCLQSPSRPVDCVLCPNTGGAFKQTDTNKWAHVVCALWIPEVRFANTVFLEPIDSIEMIPPARWRLTCYICKQKGVGACIQCNRNYCYAAFHVTCAQQAGLCMRMDQVRGNEQHPVIIQKTAYCDAHTPLNALTSPGKTAEDAREEQRERMKKARKMLAQKRVSLPIILIPTIPADKVQEIAALVNFKKKDQFLQRLIAYWTLKRQHRNGVPLLRRLQSQGNSHPIVSSSSNPSGARSGSEGSPDAKELYQQLKYWKCVRQDLERARLLCELVRKREKMKLVLIKTTEQLTMAQLNPLEGILHRVLDQLVAKDTHEIFLEPVDVDEVPDYMDIVKHPMDLGTMRLKLESGEYFRLDDLEADFDLMIKNCLAYNERDTMFYKAGVRLRDQANIIFRTTRKEMERKGLLEPPQKTDDDIAKIIDDELKELTSKPPDEKIIENLQELITKATALKSSQLKAKKVKQIKLELTKARKNLKKDPPSKRNSVIAPPPPKEVESSESEDEIIKAPPVKVTPNNRMSLQTPPCSPLKNLSNSASPSGVNRRTAVLFTRKAQAALKKPEAAVQTEDEEMPLVPPAKESTSKATTKKGSRSKRNANRKNSDNNNALSLDKPSSKKVSASPIKDPSTRDIPFTKMPDSFRVYRGQQQSNFSDSDDSNMSFTGSTCSSCSGFSGSGSGSEFGSSMDDDDDHSCSDSELNSSEMDINSNKDLEQEPPQLEPLKLVWAKCRGYPWYPALIIDPSMPKGFMHNGVPLPTPPPEVMALRKNCEESVFLVLFFDAKRTWQWLPADKLELLGLDKELDQGKLIESRKPTERKAVNKAYQEALHYQSQVSSASGPAGKL